MNKKRLQGAFYNLNDGGRHSPLMMAHSLPALRAATIAMPVVMRREKAAIE